MRQGVYLNSSHLLALLLLLWKQSEPFDLLFNVADHTCISAPIFFGETLNGGALIGGLIVLIGVALVLGVLPFRRLSRKP